MKHLRTALARLVPTLAFACALGLAPSAQAQITTPEILGQTIAAYPSCLKYQVKGMCFFLRCGFGCSIVASIRVAHFVPDAIVSTYNEPLQHPWVEVGKPLATVMGKVGQAMLVSPLLLDASANNAREEKETATFKSADVIGNPAGMILRLATGGDMPNLPDMFGVPGVQEISKFPSQELPRVQQQWTSVPQNLGNNVLEGARALARLPGDVIAFIASLPAKLSSLQSAVGNVGQIMNGGLSGLATPMKAAEIAGIDLGPLKEVVGLAQTAAGGWAIGDIFCPGSASAFTLHFFSNLDSYSWREVVPVEMLYPQSWVPTLGEVSQNPAANTWGSVYPRTGFLTQSHPVKASAVYAERVGSIIKQAAQPHIYKKLTPGSGFRYFEQMKETRWQRLYPNGETGCETFGSNDSLGLTSYGDFKTSGSDGYVWNMWNKYDCCRNRGAYLFSVP